MSSNLSPLTFTCAGVSAVKNLMCGTVHSGGMSQDIADANAALEGTDELMNLSLNIFVIQNGAMAS